MIRPANHDAPEPPDAPAASHRAWPTLLALACGAFGIGTTEFSPMGLLPVMAAGVRVSIPAAGLLVSAYAVGVMVGAPVVTLALARHPRRAVLVGLMAIFTLGNLLSALAPGYGALLAARIVTSLAHGAFFGLGSVVAASVVPPHRKASAVATLFMGLTIANIVGVPGATWLGQAIGWRPAFGAMAGFGVFAMAMLRVSLPAAGAMPAPDIRRELRVLMRAPVLLAITATVLGAGATFTLYTYIAPILSTVTRASPAFVTAMLVLVGCGFSIGNVAGGALADRSPARCLLLALTLEALVMAAFPWAAHTRAGAAVAVFTWGIAAFGMVAPLQTRVMLAAADAPGLASSMNIGAFNLGNAVGAAAGGAAISGGWGAARVPRVGVLLAVAGIALVAGQAIAARRGRPRAPAPAAGPARR
ncbi:MAG: MFS transporter [Burkholderia gladioli]